MACDFVIQVIPENQTYEQHRAQRMTNVKRVWLVVGEVSMFDIKPAVIDQLAEAIPDWEAVAVDDDLLDKVRKAYRSKKVKGRELSSMDKVLTFLEEHRGKLVYSECW